MAGILVLHGPNLNLIGQREPEIYGSMTLAEIDQRLVAEGEKLGVEVRTFQANGEGDLIDALHDAQDWASGVIFNPAGYTHTSVALRDAVAAINIPVVEVHISNVYAREKFRHKSLISPVSAGKITGFGWRSYLLALQALAWMIEEDNE
jgi:3-dehydroquinate dehydratase-2